MATKVEDLRGEIPPDLQVTPPKRRTWAVVAVIAVLLALVVGGFWLAARTSTSDVEELLDAYQEDWNAHDGEEVLAHFTPDGVIRAGQAEYTGVGIPVFVRAVTADGFEVDWTGDPAVVESDDVEGVDSRYLVTVPERLVVGGETSEGFSIFWLVERDGELLVEQHQTIPVGEP